MAAKTPNDVKSEIEEEFGHGNLSIIAVVAWINQFLGDAAPFLRHEAMATVVLTAGKTEYTSSDGVPTDIYELVGARYWDITDDEPEYELLPPAKLGDFAQPGVMYFGGKLYVQELDHGTGDKLYLYYFRNPVKSSSTAPDTPIDVPELFDYLPTLYGCARHQKSWLQDLDSARSYENDYLAGRNLLDMTRRQQVEVWLRHMPPVPPPALP
ncbi:MAG: hypothetical protein C4521_10920 [Actinobacteria bacterium]|nr:MAG: hypothetical protein C4521_10920 [Actinomycetota bacterium]